MISFNGEIVPGATARLGGGDIDLIFRGKASWLTSETVQIRIPKNDTKKFLKFSSEHYGGIELLEYKKVTVIIHA